MNRAFLSLYFFIVISVVLIGWGLDKFWETLSPPSETSAEVVDLMTLLEARLNDLPVEQQAQWLARAQPNLQHKLQIIALDDIASTSAGDTILAGDIVAASKGESSLRWDTRIEIG